MSQRWTARKTHGVSHELDRTRTKALTKYKYEVGLCSTKEHFEMSETGKTASNNNMHAMILGVLGIILVIVGGAIATIPGTHLRGSGLGTLAIVAGVVLLVIAGLRFYSKRT